MASITTLGIGSGIDANSIVSQLVALERRPLQKMQAQATDIQTQLSSMGQIQSLFSKLQDAASKLTGTTLWNSVSAATADATVVGVKSSGGTPAGSYQIAVRQLASAQSLVAPTRLTSATEPVGAGSLTFQTAREGAAAVTVEVTAADTLSTLRDKINASGAGVSASIVTDSGGSRLALRSRETGLDGAFSVTAADADGDNTDANGLSRFSYSAEAGVGQQMELRQAAGNALATVNGIDVESATNTLKGTVEGLTLTLGKVSTEPIDVTVTVDNDTIKKGITDFAAAYSDLARYIGQQTRYDEASKTGAPLQGDSATVSLQSRLRSLVNLTSGASTTLGRLSDLGLQLQRDGTMSVSDSKLDVAMGNLREVRRALSNSDTAEPANAGLARRFGDLATAVLGTDGAVTNRASGLRKELTSNQKRQDQVNEKADRTEKRLVAQYSAMDASSARLSGLNSFVTAQLNVMNRRSN